jgi:putative component of toxin-antitoxin plasmid stabilization module
MDMKAVGDFLDWLRLQHQAGYRIHLVDVNRLVAALLLSMKVGDWARLILRND